MTKMSSQGGTPASKKPKRKRQRAELAPNFGEYLAGNNINQLQANL